MYTYTQSEWSPQDLREWQDEEEFYTDISTPEAPTVPDSLLLVGLLVLCCVALEVLRG